MVQAKISETSVKIWDEEEAEKIHKNLYYGKNVEKGYLELSLVEAMHLIERGELEIVEKNGELERDEVYQKFSDKDSEFNQKYPVYSDLRERGYIVKTGFKFGTHFRVYERGVNPYKDGPKNEREHTKWIVHAVPENYNQSYQEMSRAVRLAQNIRAKILWAVVDSERGVTYYRVDRVTP